MSHDNETAISVNGLCKSFNGKIAVNHITLQVNYGEIFGFLGPNGSGKTTTIRMLCGLLTPDSGEGHCVGYDILTESKMIKNHVGYMTQHFSFYTDLSVEENLNFIAKVYLMPDRDRQVNDVLHDMGLYERRKQLTRELSGGWKQRMALAACLLHKPKLLLLDEPTAGVDPLARREFWDKIHALSEKGITTLISTHYMDEAARCDRLAYLSSGKLIISGTAEEVIASTALLSWVIEGNVNVALLEKVKLIPDVVQAAMFGNEIHLLGYNRQLIESTLDVLVRSNKTTWRSVSPSLEDAFIGLVKKTKGEF